MPKKLQVYAVTIYKDVRMETTVHILGPRGISAAEEVWRQLPEILDGGHSWSVTDPMANIDIADVHRLGCPGAPTMIGTDPKCTCGEMHQR